MGDRLARLFVAEFRDPGWPCWPSVSFAVLTRTPPFCWVGDRVSGGYEIFASLSTLLIECPAQKQYDGREFISSMPHPERGGFLHSEDLVDVPRPPTDPQQDRIRAMEDQLRAMAARGQNRVAEAAPISQVEQDRLLEAAKAKVLALLQKNGSSIVQQAEPLPAELLGRVKHVSDTAAFEIGVPGVPTESIDGTQSKPKGSVDLPPTPVNQVRPKPLERNAVVPESPKTDLGHRSTTPDRRLPAQVNEPLAPKELPQNNLPKTNKERPAVKNEAVVAPPEAKSDQAPAKKENTTERIKNFAEGLKGRVIRDAFGGTYQLDRLLGAGGMGFVFKAYRTNPFLEEGKKGVERAIKFIIPGTESNEVTMKRFEREIVVSARLTSPFVTRTIDRIETEIDGQKMIGLVTDFANASDLSQELRKSYFEGKEGRMNPARAAEYMAEIAIALCDVEQAGAVHRDLKPANVFLQKLSDGTSIVQLGDLGIAKTDQDQFNADSEQMPGGHLFEENLTDGYLLGTPDYMSPEQARGMPLTNKSDIYAAGVMLYQMLTGGYPYDKKTNYIGKQTAHLLETPKGFAQVDAKDVPEELQQLVMSMLEKDPDKRPKDGVEVFSRLKAWIAKAHPDMLNQVPFMYRFDGKDAVRSQAAQTEEGASEPELFEPFESGEQEEAA